MWRLSNTHRVLPAHILGVEDDPLASYCVNRAVTFFGQSVDKDLEEASEDKKKAQAEAARSAVLANWIGTPMKFANPAPTRR